MTIGPPRSRLARRRFICGCCGGALLGWVPAPAHATEEIIVPVTEEPRHHIRFENEYLRIIEVIVAPQDETLFHRHTLDSVLVVTRDSRIRLQQLGSPEAGIGDTSFLNYKAHPIVHRLANLGPEPVVGIDCEIILPEPGRFPPPDRTAMPSYVPEIDNERVRAWRLRIEPGQSAPPVRQAGPGVRVVLSGGRLSETVQGAPDRTVEVAPGAYEWQPAGRVRTVTNTGASPLEMVEIEVR